MEREEFRKKIFSPERLREFDQTSEFIGALIMRRKELGLTQKEVAEKSGLLQPAISRLEKFEADPTLSTLLKVAWALDLEFVLKKKEC